MKLSEIQTRKTFLGHWLWLSATAWLIIGLVAIIGCGCEDDGDRTTVNEAPVYQTGTNGGPIVVVEDVDGLVVVDLTTGDATPYDVYVNKVGSNGIVSVTTRPSIPPVADVPAPNETP